ncbi:toluene efflux pump outer membrane protein TtgF precursor [mine drainage metagenome]|uniref:Toluene efflux pump outer membrane protein TtgF n=1 Tax=mine drainage metagenome TaxID=410659 RepID=A0A1J5QFB7_9ZZZZ
MPALALPSQFKNKLPADAHDATAAPPDANEIPQKLKVPHDSGLTEWWRSFGNRELDELIDRGLANNPDLRVAMLRVAQAKERVDQAKAGKLPTITAPMLTGLQAPGGLVGTTPNSGGISQIQRNYQASLQADWHLDVWGEQSSMVESAKFQLWRAVFERDDAQRTMVANLSSAYVEYVSLNDRLKVARENEAVSSNILISLEKRVEVGDATLSDSAQQKAAIFALRATIPSLEQQREDLLNTIAFLVGAVPGTLKLSDNGLDSISSPSVIPGLPSALLLRRPDVRMAEARLLSADADIDVARARILPSIDLTAQGGLSTIIFSQFFMAKSLFWNSIANLSVSIFDNGKKESDKKVSEEAHEEMIESYIRTLNQAMREVEGALATVRLTGKRLEDSRQAVNSAREAWDISTKVYALGGVDYQTFLDTERTYHRYLDEYQHIRMENSRGYIGLFSALGGGVRPAEPLPGKGARPAVAQGGSVSSNSPPVLLASSGTFIPQSRSTEGVDRAWGKSGDDQVENFWQVELSGIYHRTAIGAVWRDLRVRYPKLMEDRFLRPRLDGRIEDSEDGQESWYRLYVAKFPSPADADELCAALKASYQRCRIVSSRSDETVTVENAKDAPDPVAHPVAETSLPEPVAAPLALNADAELKPVVLPVAATDDAAPSGMPPAVKEPSAARDLPVATTRKLAYSLQLGMFANPENARALQATWQSRGYQVNIAESPDARGRVFYAVRTGVFARRAEANVEALSIRRKEKTAVVVVATQVDPAVDSVGKPDKMKSAGVQPLDGQAAPSLPGTPEPVNAATISPPAGAQPNADDGSGYAVQLGAFPTMKGASVSQSSWSAKGYKPYIREIQDAQGRAWYTVRTGEFSQRVKASVLARSIGRKLGVPAIVVQSGEREMAQTGSEDALEKSASAKKQAGFYAVQLDAFSSLDAAARSYADWRSKGYEVYVCELRNAGGRALFAVRTGQFSRRREAAGLAKAVERKNQIKAILVPAELDAAGNLAKVEVGALI